MTAYAKAQMVLAPLTAADSYEALIRALPPNTDDDTYGAIHDDLQVNPALDGGRQFLLQLLAKKTGPCPRCGNIERFHSPSRDCTGVL